MANGSSLLSHNQAIRTLCHDALAAGIPTIVWICLAIFIGLVGNVFVVIVFGFKMKKQSSYRHFILVLAIYDLTACTVGMPGLAIEIAHPYAFRSRAACKLLRYGFHIIACGSSLTHLLVGIDRYRRICRPTGVQISSRAASIASLCIISVTMILNIPVFVMYDTVRWQTKVANYSGVICDISERYSGTAMPFVVNGILLLCSIIVVIVLLILYSLIGIKICSHVHFFNLMERAGNVNGFLGGRSNKALNGMNATETTAHTSIDNTTIDESTAQDRNPRRQCISSTNLDKAPVKSNIGQIRKGDDQLSRTAQSTFPAEVARIGNDRLNGDDRGPRRIEVAAPLGGVGNNRVSVAPPNARHAQYRESLSRRMTVVTFAIMVVYIVSFIPLQILTLVTLTHEHIEHEMTFSQLALYRFGYHTYIINDVANPLVYLFMDVEFRRHCSGILQRMFCR